MIELTTTIKKFDNQGEKTGWTYIDIPADIAQKLKPNNKRSFRVKGKLDNYPIDKIALVPMGGGDFIMALNATMRKALKKTKGDQLKVQLSVDESIIEITSDLINCLSDEPLALAQFQKLPKSHQLYYSRWIESAKTETTRTKRIAQTVSALTKKMDFGEMIRSNKKEKNI